MRLVVIGGEISSKMEMVYLFRSRDLSFWQNNVYHHRRFLDFKKNNQNLAAGFALFTVVETSRFIGLKCKHTFRFYVFENTHLQ